MSRNTNSPPSPQLNFSDIKWTFNGKWLVGIITTIFAPTIAVVLLYANLNNKINNLDGSLQKDEPLLMQINNLTHNNIGRVDRLENEVNVLLEAKQNRQNKR